MREASSPQIEFQQGSKPNHIKISGTSREYCQGLIRTFWLEMGQLRFVEEYTSYGTDKMFYSRSLVGKAELVKDKIGVIGSAEVPLSTAMPVLVKPLEPADEGEHSWAASIGWSPGDWEIGSGDSWFVEAYVPLACFENLLGALAANRAEVVSLGLDTNAWAEAGDWYAPPSVSITWYLKPDKHGAEIATGRVTSFRWAPRPIAAGSNDSVPELLPGEPSTSDAGSLGRADHHADASKITEALIATGRSLKLLCWLIGIAVVVLIFK